MLTNELLDMAHSSCIISNFYITAIIEVFVQWTLTVDLSDVKPGEGGSGWKVNQHVIACVLEVGVKNRSRAWGSERYEDTTRSKADAEL